MNRHWLPLVLAALLSVRAAPLWSGDSLLLETSALLRGGDSLLVILPNGTALASRTVAERCQEQLATGREILVLELGGLLCRTTTSAAVEGPVLNVGLMNPVASVPGCLAAHHAVLEDSRTGLSTCFRWFECTTVEVEITGPGSVCEGGWIELDAGAGFSSYLWSPGGETSRTLSAAPLTDTVYHAQVTDEWDCEGSDDHQVVVNPSPDPVIDGPTAACSETASLLDAGAGFASYQWSPGGEMTQAIEVNPVSTTDYSVTVSTLPGCDGTSPDHRLEVWPLPTPVISGPTHAALGQLVTLDAGTGYLSYDWSTGQVTQSIEVSPVVSTGYTVSVGDGNGCHAISPEHWLVIVPGAVFIDGFESGDTRAWSSSRELLDGTDE